MVEPKPSKTEFVAVTIAKDLREPRKNIDFVVRALEKASFDSGQKITLILIGQNGGAFSSSKVRLVWLGELSADKIVGRIASADVLLSGSLAESAGMTVVECAAMGIPSVALENGGTASLIRDGVSGILARDFDSFTSGVVDLIQSPRKLSTLGASALKSSELHRPTAVGRKYLEVYESMT
jgi:glycosyltransferase involved in cell wall biosynthesis